ncbi:MAG: glycosyltransferase family 2 protein [Deltaproteobacteria bacterium]|nr:MAG: glycosyltransferase family 2 protein [Deltaproteobacteria bacterium]
MNNLCSVVVRCYNEEQHIGRLLSGILQQTIWDVEIIIVDSGSVDATLSIASQYPVKILSITPEEFSFGRSLNIGCEEASGEFIVIASAHVYPVYRDWLEQLLAPFTDPQVALVYGKQRGNGRTKYSEHQVFARWFPEKSNPHQDHPFCNNANAAIRRSVWEKLPYDENLTGLEDIDWARRAMQLGYKIVYVSDAEVIHVHNESPIRLYNRYRREAIALKHIFPQERFNFWEFVRLFVTNVVSDCYHAWHDGVLWHNLISICLFRLMQFWGTYRGFTQRSRVTSQLKQTFYYPNNLKSPKFRMTKSKPGRRIEYAIPPDEG